MIQGDCIECGRHTWLNKDYICCNCEEKMKCENCHWWKKDYGIWCFNGWSGTNRDNGHCHFDIKKVYKKASDYCSNFRKEK